MTKAKNNNIPADNSDKPAILNFVKTEYLVGFFAMALIIFGAVAGEQLYPSRESQTTESQAAITRGEGKCEYDKCECLSGFPDSCRVNHYYSQQINVKPVPDLLEGSKSTSSFSMECGTEHIMLEVRQSPADSWESVDDTYISHFSACRGQ